MGRGDNRKTLKSRQRKQWRRLKSRIKARIEAGKVAPKGARKAPAPAGTTVRRPGADDA